MPSQKSPNNTNAFTQLLLTPVTSGFTRREASAEPVAPTVQPQTNMGNFRRVRMIPERNQVRIREFSETTFAPMDDFTPQEGDIED